MQIENIATPFGRRPAKLAHLQQHAARETTVGKVADKWRVFHAISVAMVPLRLSSTCIALLRALVSFYPEDELTHVTQLVVFPSNRQLSLRANGMAEATIRRNISILAETGLIIRRDSANGKRFARKGENGQVATAFGFDLSPLLARAEELELMAKKVEADRATFRHAKEDLTICRRDVRKLIDAAIEDDVQGDWLALEQVYSALVARIPRKPSTLELVYILDEMTLLRDEVINRLNLQEISENNSGNAADSERHIQDSKPEHPFEFENGSEGMKTDTAVRGAETLKMFSLEMVLRMCPQISDYAPGGRISSWRDLLSTAVTVRSMLGVSPSAYQDACEVMGPENAATIMACILERAGHINSAGGYLRDLTARSRRGEFSLRPMLMALSRPAL